MLSWDSQSGTSYWVYKFITSKKYTIKKPPQQKGSPEKILQAKTIPIYRIKCYYVCRDFPEDLRDLTKRLDVYFLSSWRTSNQTLESIQNEHICPSMLHPLQLKPFYYAAHKCKVQRAKEELGEVSYLFNATFRHHSKEGGGAGF